MDIDDLLKEINSAGEQNKSKGKKKKAKLDNQIPSTDQIVQTFDAIKLGDPKKTDENIKIILDGDGRNDVVKVLEDGIKLENNVELNDEEKKKKKRKKKKKAGAGTELENEKDIDEEVQTKINQYRNCFDFTGKNITNSRFQDNQSVFRVIKNWEDKPWNQT